MPPRQRAYINPKLLVWGREQSSLTLEAAARRIHVSPEKLLAWESDADKPTIKQLRKAARVYHLSLAIFYLQEPPWLYQPIRDYRRIFGAAQETLSPELAIEIRQAHDRRDVAAELYAELEETPPDFGLRISAGDDPETVGEQIRGYIGVQLETQRRWRDSSVAFREWRLAFERRGILVFQASGIDLDEMRGFSIGDSHLPVIVVNRTDAYAARVFTLIHEVAHLGLRDVGLCNLAETGSQSRELQRIETFCNRVAGAALVPRAALLGHGEVADHPGTRWAPKELDPIAREFKVSRQVIIRRLLTLGRTNQAAYDVAMEAMYEEFRSIPRRAGGFLAPPENTLSLVGRLYTKLALSAYHQNRIGPAALSDFLGVRLKHLPALEQIAV